MNAKEHLSTDFNAVSIIGGKNSILKVNNKKYIIEIKDIPECFNACPAGVNVKAYVNLIANKKFEDAVDVIRQANPFPAICGRVCTRPCEENCEQGEKGDSVSIRALKRYAADYELARRSLVMEPCKQIYNEKIAIIGAGPAGLSAAVDLILMGYPVTVFESEKEPGGMLRYAIPSYRLPKRILKREIDWIKGLGIKIVTEKQINNPESLFKKDFSAVLIAQGAPKSLDMGIDGEDADGVIDPLLFLKTVNTDNPMDIKGNIVVIGGGSTAFDVARSAIRLGAKKVTIAYRRGIKEMPAENEEIQDAKKEGVIIKILVIPKKIIVNKGKVTGMGFLKATLGKPDESGRRRPIPVKGSEFVINADIIIPAIGAKPDVVPFGNVKITNKKDRVEVKENGITQIKGVFAAGDVEMGPSSVVEAIGRGHNAAKGINAYLRGEDLSVEEKPIPIVIDPKTCSHMIHHPKRLEKKEAISSFNEVEKPYSEFEAVEEALRCFTCGPCYICSVCLPNCEHKQLIAHIDKTTFLLKVPNDLSLKVTEKGPINSKIQSKGKTKAVELESLTAKVDKDLCIGCGRCEEVCAYRAVVNTLIKNKKITAEVDHNSCASCSACVSVCPTGAVTQGYMSDGRILSRIKEKKTPYIGVKALMSYWSTPNHAFGIYDGITEIMSARKPSPSFLIRALARTGKGLLVIGPDEKTGSHYLPWDEHPKNTVQKAKNLLKLVGISPDRIQYESVPNNTDPSYLLKEFSESLDKKKLKNLTTPIPKISMNPLGESMALLRIMWANSDTNPSDEFINMPPAKFKGVAFFEGCMPMLHMIGKTHKLFDLGPTRLTINKLLKKAKIEYGSIPKLSCPAKGLLKLEINGAEDIVEKISSKNIKAINRLKPQKLIIGTPEAFMTFSKEKDLGNISSLPDELLKILKGSKDISPIKKTVAIHNACLMEKDPYHDTTKKLLSLIPGISIVELNSKCGHYGFDKIDGNSKKSALKLLDAVAEKGVDTIVCTSPYCKAHLLMCQREGSWRTTDINVTDAYNLLLTSLEGGDI